MDITNEDKNSLTLSNESKDDGLTWEDSDPLTWGDDTGTWKAPKVPFNKESKNALSITNEAKN